MNVRSLLLTGLIATAPGLLSVDVAARPERPVKTAKECNDELRVNTAKLEKAGVSATEFFHNCWWNSKPGQPTPIVMPVSDRPAEAPTSVEPRRGISSAAPEPYHAPTPTEAGIVPRVSATTEAPVESGSTAAPEPYHAPTPDEAAAAARGRTVETGRAEPARRGAYRRANLPTRPQGQRYRPRRERDQYDASRPVRRRAPVEPYVVGDPAPQRPGGQPEINILQIPAIAADIADRALAGRPVPAPEISAVVRGIVNPQIPPGALPPPF